MVAITPASRRNNFTRRNREFLRATSPNSVYEFHMFRDVSHWISHNPAAMHYGIAAGLVGSVGQLCFFICGYGSPNRRLEWTGSALRDTATRRLADVDHQAIGVACADFNGDGLEELYILNTDTYAGPKQHADRLFQLAPDGHWHDLFKAPANQTVRNLSSGRSVAAIDRRGTGRYDFVVANYSRPFRLYECDSAGTIIDLAPSLGLNRVTGGRGLWVGPFISEHSSDIVCGNEHGPNFLFINQGDGQFQELAGEFGLRDSDEHARGLTALDANGDGRLDLCYGNWEGPHRLMLRQINGIFKDEASPALAMPSPIRTVIAADFDNDGYEELFFNNLGEANRLFRQEESGWRWTDIGAASLPEGFGTGAAVADIDGDGVLELLISHGESVAQPMRLCKTSTSLNWFRVMPLTRFGAPARGASVRLEAGGRTQIRVIDGGSGYLCQMEPVAHFGLGNVDLIQRVTITWPDGATAQLERPAIRQLVKVSYPAS
jgi:hypothetical protein